MPAAVGLLLVGLPLPIWAFMTFDQLVVLQFSRHPEQWVRDRRPCTFMRPATGIPRTVRSALAAQWCSISWVFVTPAWVARDPDCAGLLRRLRLLTAAWCLIVVPLTGIAAAAGLQIAL